MIVYYVSELPAGLLCVPELLERAGLEYCERLNSTSGASNSALFIWQVPVC